MRRLLLALLIIASPAVLVSAGDRVSEADKVFQRGQDHFYNGEYGPAVDSFESYIGLRPEDPRGYWRKAYAQYFAWKEDQPGLFPKVSPREKDAFLEVVEKGIQKADQDIAVGKDVDFARYVKACLYSMRAGIEFRNVSKLTALSSLRETLRLAALSRYPDAKYLVGLTNYSGADHYLPFVFAGLPHNREVGLEKIYEAFVANEGPFARDIAFVIFRIETDPKNARRFSPAEVERFACWLQREYPRNRALNKYCDLNRCRP